MKKSMYIWAISLVLILNGCGGVKEASSAAANQNTEIKESQGIEAWGEVAYLDGYEVTIDFPAVITEIYVKEGDRVSKGDKLFCIDYEDYKQSIAKKEKELELEEVVLEGLLKNVSPQQTEVLVLKDNLRLNELRLKDNTDPDIKALESRLINVNEDLEKLEKDYEIGKELLGIDSISKREYEELQNVFGAKRREKEQLMAALVKLKADKELEINRLKTNIAYKQEELDRLNKLNTVSIQQQQIKKEVCEIDILAMKNKLNRLKIKDDNILFDLPKGIISKVQVQEGGHIGVNGQPSMVMTVIDSDSIIVKANVAEEFIREVRIGAKADIIPYADKAKVIEGVVTRIAETAVKENGETVVKVDIKVKEDEGFLKGGFGVDVTVFN